jgi:diacylglycerol kinase family enzyme
VLNGARPGTVLGFVPGGGTSVLPRALGLPRDPLLAARRIAAGRTRRISLGRANGRRFGFAAGVGLDAELIRRVDALGRREDGRRPGDVAFALTALRTLAEHRVRFDPALEVVGHGRAAFALVANADPYSYVGRLPLRLPRGAAFEGGLDLLAPRALRARSLPGAVRYLATGRTRLPLVHLHDADRIELRCDAPLPLQVDGEDLGDVTEVVLEAERDAVDVLV